MNLLAAGDGIVFHEVVFRGNDSFQALVRAIDGWLAVGDSEHAC